MAKTSAQIMVDSLTGELQTSTSSYRKFRTMRKHPTIALAREYSVAYVLACSWSIEGNDENEVAFVENTIKPLRSHYLRTALYGQADFGWKAYEKVFAVRGVLMPDETTVKLQCLDQLKPLLNDAPTLARYKQSDGTFNGLASTDQYSGEKILIDAAHSLFVNFDDEGLGNYAEGRLARIESTYDQWIECNTGAAQYDKKMAGLYLIVYFPVGETLYKGVSTENSIIAKDIIEVMRSSGAVTIPVDLADMIEKGNAGTGGWKIEFLDSNAKQASFVDRLKYLDALIARGFAVPERAILEGEFGTKAEAGVHASAALMNMDLQHQYLTEFFNWHVVNQLTVQNFDTENTVRIVAQPVNDDRRQLFQSLLDKIMADPAGGPEVIDAVNIKEVCNVLGIPLEDLNDTAEIEPDSTQEAATEPLSTTNGSTIPAASTNGAPRRISISMN